MDGSIDIFLIGKRIGSGSFFRFLHLCFTACFVDRVSCLGDDLTSEIRWETECIIEHKRIHPCQDSSTTLLEHLSQRLVSLLQCLVKLSDLIG